jgi:D-glycero-D-manno-heptose 1,7-bisphosphate phosphatase
MSESKRKAVLLDRDGVLNFDKGYTFRLADLALLPGVAEGLKSLQEKGFVLLVITNQSGVARGYYSLNDVAEFNAALSEAVWDDSGAKISQFYVCPHHPDGSVAKYSCHCECRKPGTKLVFDAASDWNIDLKESWFVGDKMSDVECGLAAGTKTILISNKTGDQSSGPIAENFAKAVEIILQA